MNEVDAWDMYFAACCSWLFHPGYLRSPEERPSVKDIADVCDEMLEERNSRWVR